MTSGTQNETSSDFVEGRLLDGFLLLAAGGSSTPDDVVCANLSSLQIVDVAEEDLTFFANLDRLDLGDNQLSYEQILDHMGRLPRLGSLVLACNSIGSLQVQSGTLRSLHTLDLSYNELHGDVLSQLASLPSLVTLNLASNCISSVPSEEELYGLQALEELILDANDLVQFVQWRALDAIPRLRKLSLASNRVKRLKDDTPDTAGNVVSYFPSLEELDLSSNEIIGVECLPAARLFLRLKTLRLNDNPCTRGPSAVRQLVIPGVEIQVQDTKAWYLKGSGCHQKVLKNRQPRLKMDREKLIKVRSDRQELQSRQRPPSQLGVFDEEANQLMVSLGSRQWLVDSQQSSFLTAVEDRPPSPSGSVSHVGILNDDLSEEELDQILRERQAHIDRKFKAEIKEMPASFMRKPPFEDSSTKQRLQRLMVAVAEENLAPQERRLQPNAEAETRRRASGLSVTPFAESAGSYTNMQSVLSITKTSPSIDISGFSGYGGYSPSPYSPFSSMTPALKHSLAFGPSPVTTGFGGSGVQLPPIRGAVAFADSCLSERAHDLLGPASVPRKPTGKAPDMGVREAIRALRAAAMSEYAAPHT